MSGKEDAIKITPPIDLTLEYGVEFIDDDELVEITPKSVRLRKRFLKNTSARKTKFKDLYLALEPYPRCLDHGGSCCHVVNCWCGHAHVGVRSKF